MRLDKALAPAGLSRSDAKKAIRQGRVAVDGRTASDPGMDVEGKAVFLDGRPVEPDRPVHVMIHKPKGMVTAARDNSYDAIYELLSPEVVRRKPGACGRLDQDVTGLVIMTTDGQLAHRLISPKRSVAKRYRATVEGKIGESAAERFRQGIEFKDFTTLPAELTILEAGEEKPLIEIVITEGKYHQVKRMCAAVGCPVLELSRIVEAGVRLDEALSPGEWRHLTEEEVAQLYRAAGMEH